MSFKRIHNGSVGRAPFVKDIFSEPTTKRGFTGGRILRFVTTWLFIMSWIIGMG